MYSKKKVLNSEERHKEFGRDLGQVIHNMEIARPVYWCPALGKVEISLYARCGLGKSLTVSLSLQSDLRGNPLIHPSYPYYYDVAFFDKDCFVNKKTLKNPIN